MGSSVGTAEERLVRRLPLPGLLRRSLEVRMVCTATVIGLLLIVLLLTFVTDRIRSEVFADQRDVILADAALRASVAQAEFDSTTAVTVDEVSAAAEFVRAKRLRGVVLLGGHFDYTRAEVAGINVPFVCCSFDNQFGDLDSADYSSVSIDDTAEAFKATSTLIGAGHTHVAMLLDSSSSNSIGELRYKGYCAALLDAGIQLDDDLVVEVGDFSMAATYEATAKLLARRPDVTAIFAISDLMGVAAMKAASDAGLRTPDDISVIAIDGIETTLYTIPTLTTLCQPQETLGKQAVKILVDVLDKRLPSKHVRLETTLREGGSVARAR